MRLFGLSEKLISWSASKFYKELEVPHYFLVQLFAIEDQRFAFHPGIDPIAITRATIINLQFRKVYEGASTITQQLYNAYQEKDGGMYSGRFGDKVRQATWALSTDASWSKFKILSEYLKNIYWGKYCYGIDEAALSYFNSTRQDITVPQSFFLAERIASPNYVDVQRVSILLKNPSIVSIFMQNPLHLSELVSTYEDNFNCGDKLCHFLAK